MLESAKSALPVGCKSVFSCDITNWWGNMDKAETLLKEQQLKVSWALQKRHWIYEWGHNIPQKWSALSQFLWSCIVLYCQFHPRHGSVYWPSKGKVVRFGEDLQTCLLSLIFLIGNFKSTPDGFSLAFAAVKYSGLFSWWCFWSLVLGRYFPSVFCCSISSWFKLPWALASSLLVFSWYSGHFQDWNLS